MCEVQTIDQTGAKRGPSAADVRSFMMSLSRASSASDDRERIELIAALEELKAASGAAQARETRAFARSRQEIERSRPSDTIPRSSKAAVRRSVAAQIALARKVSPHMGSRLVGLAETLAADLPHTFAAMASGVVSEWRATLLTRETACLSDEHRRAADAELAGRLSGLSDKRLVAEVRRIAYRLDPHAVVRRHERAVSQRRVSLRPAPDAMTYLTALLPLTQGVACLAALKKAAAAARADGTDDRSEGQVMADTLVERLTGQESAAAVPVEVQLVMTDETLFADSTEPARLVGHGPIPAPIARRMLADLPAAAQAWVRRLFMSPATGEITAMDTRRRCFTGLRRQAVIIRDEICRTPYCDAPIKQVDHVISTARGGITGHGNGQGLCEACNYVKEQPGWRSRPDPGGGASRSVTITTPTGHTHTSVPPPLPGAPPPRPAA